METLVRRLVDGGLERVGRPVVGEIEEVARTAHHGRLVRIERELTGLATATSRYLDRDPGFRTEGWVALCNRIWLLGRAAREVVDGDPDRVDEVLGVYRRTYTGVDGTLLVHALGASGWVSDSGFVGITVHLWDPVGARVLQATQARPIAMLGRDPRRLLFHPVSEVTPLTVHELAHGAWVLDDVRLSADGRLSLHAGLQATAAAPIGRRAYQGHACDGADAILDRLSADELAPIGGSGAVLVFVEVAEVRVDGIDETRAVAVGAIVDRTGAVLRVVSPLRPEHDLLFDNLVRLQTTPPVGMFGRAWVAGGELRFEPYTAVFESPVRLSFRRAGTVQEVHLALEPLPGEVKIPRIVRAPGGSGRVRSGLEPAVADVAAAVDALFATGLALPDAEIGTELRTIAARWDAAEAAGIAGIARTLADEVDAIRDGDRSRLADAHRSLHQLTAWVRMFRAGATLRAARTQALAGVPPTVRRGEDLVVVPVGAEVSAHRVLIHGVRADDGAAVVLEDEMPGLDPDDPAGREAPSRLFQATVRLGDLLRHTIVLRDHPVARGAGKWVVRPAFHSAATMGEEVPADVLSTVGSPVGGVPFRIRAWARRTPEGWQLMVPGIDPVPVDDPLLQLDLEKRFGLARPASPERSAGAGGSFDIVAILRRDALIVLQIGGTFPTLDPRATRWPRTDRVRSLFAGLPPPDGGADPTPERVRAELEAVRRQVASGGVVPSGRELWALGRAASRLAGRDPDDRPIAAVGLPVARLRLAAVAPLARWLRVDEPADEQVVDAAILLLGCGEVDTVFG